MNASKSLLPSLVVAFGAMTSGSGALAQDDGDSLAIEEIVVTATRVETNLMTTSIAVSAFDQDTLDKNGVKDIRDAAALVPNFDVAFSPVDSGVQLTMRGINSNHLMVPIDWGVVNWRQNARRQPAFVRPAPCHSTQPIPGTASTGRWRRTRSS